MLQVGPFDDFKGEDVLLIWGDAEGIEMLFRQLDALAKGRVSSAEVGRDTSPGILTIRVQGEAGSTLTFPDDGIAWTLSRGALDEALRCLSTLCEVDRGHQYLDTEGYLIKTVLVSKEEYPAIMPVRVAR